MGQDESVVDPFLPAALGPLTLRNRFIKSATFEGMADSGLVSERIVRAVETNRARVVIGADARLLDLMARLSPGRSTWLGRLTSRLVR